MGGDLCEGGQLTNVGTVDLHVDVVVCHEMDAADREQTAQWHGTERRGTLHNVR